MVANKEGKAEDNEQHCIVLCTMYFIHSLSVGLHFHHDHRSEDAHDHRLGLADTKKIFDIAKLSSVFSPAEAEP